MRGKAIATLAVEYLAPILRGEEVITGVPADATCLRVHYDMEHDRLLLLLESAEFPVLRAGSRLPDITLTARRRDPVLTASGLR